MRHKLKPWLKISFWTIKFPIKVRVSRIAILFILNIAVILSTMAIYDTKEGLPLVGLCVGAVFSALFYYLFLIFTQHNKKTN